MRQAISKNTAFWFPGYACEYLMSRLRAAVAKNHVELVAMMLDRGAVANEWIQGRPQPILLATSAEMLDVLLKNRALPNVRDKFGLTPLHRAVERGDLRSVEVLLQNGADPNIADNVDTPPLHRAARAGRTEIVRALLKGGAKIDARDRAGRTALDIALEYDRADTAEEIRRFVGESPR